MRPVRLEIQGFSCYREKQVIDFSRLGLFIISGPTGSGKSSILDAIAFALYGKIPRMGGQNLDEFISLGAARASVLFDFDLKNERFRVARTMPRSGARKVQLERITNGSSKALADGAGDVNAQLQQLLGLEYDAFIQSVLLPQGQFAKFLQSKPSEQRQILRELLRLGIYERMRERAFAQAKELAIAIDNDRKLLEGPFVAATPENVIQLEQEAAELNEKRELAGRQQQQCRRSLEVMQSQWKLLEERQERCDRLRRLRLEQLRIEQLRETVERARQVGRVMPVVDQAIAKLNACVRMEEEVQTREVSLRSAKRFAANRELKLQDATARNATLPQKRQRILELTQIQPVVGERNALLQRRDLLRIELSRAEKAIARGRTAWDAAQRAAGEWNAKRDGLTRQRQELGYDLAAHTTFKNANRPAHDLGGARRQAAAMESEIARVSVQSAEAVMREAEKEFEAATREQAAAEDKSKTADSAYEAVQDQSKAAALRLGLTRGCQCPVCAQPVLKIPATAPTVDLDRARRAAATAKKVYVTASERASLSRDKFNRTQANLESARNHQADWEAQCTRAWNRVEEISRDLARAIRPFDCPTGMLIELFVEQELTRFEKLHARWQELSEHLNDATLNSQRAEAGREVAGRSLETEESNKCRLDGDIAESGRRLAEYDAQISAVASGDPAGESGEIQKEIAELEELHIEAIEEHRKASDSVHQAELRVTEAKATLASAIKDRDEWKAASERALREAGFLNEAGARKAAMDPSAIAAGESEIQAFERGMQQAAARIQELDEQLQGVSLTAAEVEEQIKRTSEADAAFNLIAHKIGERTGQLQRLKADTAKAEALRVDYAKRRSRHALVHQLSQDLKGDGFQQYLLDGSFRRLVNGASERLRELNERYELAFLDGRFSVLDHDHGGLSRLADTLSGGETFLVSLALALELSEQVQQAAGAVRLDSLFIDEGFGTLDAETLETVAGAIESLAQTNRMVGVITHVAELHRRLPRLEVRPTASGSVVRYVED